MPVLYLNDIKGDNFEVVRTENAPVNRSRTGYGSKLPTQYMIIDRHAPHVKRRVYAICYSNAASLYVLISGIQYFIRDCDMPENPRTI